MGKSSDATVIDPATETVVATIQWAAAPSTPCDGRGMIYDNIEDKDEVVALDSRTNTVKARWPIAPSGGATAMEMDVEHRRLFIGGRNKVLAIMDATAARFSRRFPLGMEWTRTSTSLKQLCSSLPRREGTLHIFHEDHA